MHTLQVTTSQWYRCSLSWLGPQALVRQVSGKCGGDTRARLTHVGHTTSDAGQQSPFRVVHCDVKIG